MAMRVHVQPWGQDSAVSQGELHWKQIRDNVNHTTTDLAPFASAARPARGARRKCWMSRAEGSGMAPDDTPDGSRLPYEARRTMPRAIAERKSPMSTIAEASSTHPPTQWITADAGGAVPGRAEP